MTVEVENIVVIIVGVAWVFWLLGYNSGWNECEKEINEGDIDYGSERDRES